MIDQVKELPEDGLKSSPEMSRYIENKWISRNSNKLCFLHVIDCTDGTIIADEECCFDKKKRMRKGKQCTPRKKYPKPTTEPNFDKNIFAIHKHPHSNSNAIDHIEYLFQEIRNTSFKKIGAYYSNP